MDDEQGYPHDYGNPHVNLIHKLAPSALGFQKGGLPIPTATAEPAGRGGVSADGLSNNGSYKPDMDINGVMICYNGIMMGIDCG